MIPKRTLIFGSRLLFLLLAFITDRPAAGHAAADYVPPAPPNDNFGNAETLVLNKRVKSTENIASATLEVLEGTDPDLTHCPVLRSVWYSFTPPFNGVLAFSTAGSKMYWSPYGYSTDTVIAVYQGTTLDTLAEVACNNDYSGSIAEIPALVVRGGVTYYVRVGMNSSDFALWGWVKTIAVVRDAANYDPGDFQNLRFEDPRAPAWTLTGALNGDQRECDGANCTFKFVGGPGEATRLQQVRDWPVGILLARDHHMFEMLLSVLSTPDADFKIQLTAVYSDGTPSTKGTVFVINEVATVVSNSLFFESPNVKKIKVIFINRAVTGSVVIDGIVLDYDGALLRDAVLPVPGL